MIYEVAQHDSVCERDELCVNYWIACTLSKYVEDRKLYAKLCTHIIA